MNQENELNVHSEVARRTVLKSMLGAAAAGVVPSSLAAPAHPYTSIKGSINPRWYGFNLLELFSTDHTPANVAHAWFSDSLDVIGDLRTGWGLWNFRGPIGILDTKRPGTKYKNWYGHQLDFTLLDILRSKMDA